MNEVIKVFSIPELSKKTGIPAWTIRKLVHDGKLPVLEMGRKWYVRLSDFEKLFETKEAAEWKENHA